MLRFPKTLSLTLLALALRRRVVEMVLGGVSAISAIGLAGLGSSAVQAQSVALTGMMGQRALLVVDGAAPKSVAVGETHQGVRLVSSGADQAVVEIKGLRSVLQVGGAPVSVGGKAKFSGGDKIVLPLGSGGHFFAQGWVNGKSVQFLVDTGATSVSLGTSDAQRMGLDYQKGRSIRMNTANGQAQAWQVKLHSVRINDVEVFDVDAVVGPDMPFALLGNSFLSRFTMNRGIDTMVLERR